MAVKGGSKRRVLWIDRSRGLLIRLSPTANATATDESLAPTLEFSLSSVIKLEPLIGEPCKLRIIATSTTDVYDLKEFAFASPDSRARFSGQINLIRWGVDPAKARVLGVNRAGFSPLPLDLYCSTFNVAESKPPSDVSSLIGLIPPHKVCVCEASFSDGWRQYTFLYSLRSLTSTP